VKRFIFGFLITFFIGTSLHAQQVQTQKIPFVPKEANILQSAPASAFNSKTGQSLIVWERAVGGDHSVVGRLINSKGKPVSGNIVFANPPAAHPSIVYNSVRNEFLLAYDDNPDPLKQLQTNIFLVRVNAKGRPAAAAAKVTTDSISAGMANFLPKLAFNAKTGNYGLIWLREILMSSQIPLKNNGLVGTILVSPALTPGAVGLITNTVIEGASGFWWPIPLSFVYHPTNGKAIIGFVQVVSGTNSTNANYTLATLEPNFTNVTAANFGRINSSVLQLSSEFSWGINLAFQSNGNGLVFFVDSLNLKRRKINKLGKLSGPAAAAFRVPKNNSKLFFPSIAFINGPSGFRGMLLAVESPFSETGAANVWAQVLSDVGLPIGNPVKLDTTISTETAVGTTMVGIPQPASTPGYRFAGFYTQAAFIPPGQTFQTSGILELNLNATIP
jgi:hypothetical protein